MQFLHRIKDVFRSPNRQRYITAILFVGMLALILLINDRFLVWGVLGALFLLSLKESLGLFGLRSALHYYIAAGLIWLGVYFVAKPLYCVLAALIAYASYLAYSKRISPKALLPFIYPTLPFVCIWVVYVDFERLGLLALILVAACTDTGAYFGGKAFGRTPFCLTSPNKTVEGVIIGILCGVIVGSIFYVGFTPNFLFGFVCAFVVSVSAVFGDLFESYLKREANLKDSGKILPGHGGMLDRLDAILFAAIAMLFVLSFVHLN